MTSLAGQRSIARPWVWPIAFVLVVAIGVPAAQAAPPPTVSGFTPTSGPIGTAVTITGDHLGGATDVTFHGTPATFTIDPSNQISTEVPAGATTGPISVTTDDGTGTSSTAFTVTLAPAPAIDSFSPANGPVGTSITINGTDLTGATAVTFNGTAASSVTVNSATKITAAVPAGATTGKIAVTTPSGTATSSTNFTVKPKITSFAPTSGTPGISVTINGTSFTGATAVKFHGTSATFTVNSGTKITATVPSGATTGPIAVTTPSGTATSSSNFTVTGAPRIGSFSPRNGPVGTSVTIDGSNFAGATAVKFGGISAPFTVNSSTKITATVPADAGTGTVSVTTPLGTATSSGKFSVTPTITSFSPTSGAVGDTVTVFGTGFSGVTAVRFNGTASDPIAVLSSTQISTRVPAGGTTGTIAVTTAGGSASSATTFTVLHRRSVTLSIRGAQTASGFVTTTDGFIACARGVSVKIQRHGPAHWRTIVDLVTLADGSFSARIPNTSGHYRARASRLVLPSGDVCNQSTSPRVRH